MRASTATWLLMSALAVAACEESHAVGDEVATEIDAGVGGSAGGAGGAGGAAGVGGGGTGGSAGRIAVVVPECSDCIAASCADANTKCLATPDCEDALSCIIECGPNEACVSACFDAMVDGAIAATDVLVCITGPCFEACTGGGTGGTSGSSGVGGTSGAAGRGGTTGRGGSAGTAATGGVGGTLGTAGTSGTGGTGATCGGVGTVCTQQSQCCTTNQCIRFTGSASATCALNCDANSDCSSRCCVQSLPDYTGACGANISLCGGSGCRQNGRTCDLQTDCCNYAAGTARCIDLGRGGPGVCSATCTSNANCQSNCCRPLNGGGNACFPAEFCTAT